MSNRLNGFNRARRLQSEIINRPASDTVKLLWNEIMGPANAAAQTFNVMLSTLTERTVREAARKDGIDLKLYALNVDTMTWQLREQPQPVVSTSDDPVGNPSG